ncbi:hypothetical protein GCM10022224_074250 [Nonomuraea antimicrobica]|uniref:SGNH hydrolase-type esterase domain-containing protein n=1 Tax=Nonomuraea antimicrobica TaxID=561173 RepID=A0ABP7D095_9ACTN
MTGTPKTRLPGEHRPGTRRPGGGVTGRPDVRSPDLPGTRVDLPAETGVIRVAALGDSVTVGMGDPVRGRGWAGLLAESLAPSGRVELGNYAVCGARVADVVRDQLPRALELRPTVATVLVGVNDTLRGDFDQDVFAADYAHLLARLSETSAVVLTCTLPDPGLMLRLPGALHRPLARRARAINDAVAGPAARHGTVHLDLACQPALYERRMWGVDRLHPGERGHRHLARLFAAELAARGLAVRLPDPEPAEPEPSAWASAFWLATAGTAWLARRCLDFLPAFARLVADEYRRGPDPAGDPAVDAAVDPAVHAATASRTAPVDLELADADLVDVEFACPVPAGEPRVDHGRDEPGHEGRHRGRVVPAAGERGHQLGLPHP